MNAPDLPTLFAVPLTRLGIEYAVTGGVAAITYGEPRLTRDIDIVLRLYRQDALRFLEAFPPQAFYVPPLEALEAEIARPQHGHFNILHLETGLRADFYLATHDALDTWALEAAHPERLETGEISLAPAEYVIVKKLEYYRDGGSQRHLEDIRAMLEVSQGQIDLATCAAWVERRGLDKEWREATS